MMSQLLSGVACGVVLLALSAATAWAVGEGAPAQRVTLYVNNVTGSDDFDGSRPEPAGDGKAGPLARIMAAMDRAPSGAIISVANTGKDYRERVDIRGHAPAKPDADGPRPPRGTPAAPLVLDGHGATVSGLVRVPAERWTLLKDDVYWFENRDPDSNKPGPMPNSNWLGFWKHQGWFSEPEAPEIFFNHGKAMPHVNDLAKIPAGGFFYDTLARPRRLYYRLPAGQKLADQQIDVPLNEGVFVDADYVVVRNLRSVYSQDDGFAGFWGFGVVFENCDGSFNCDQGISLHGTSVTLIDGGLFERNGGAGIVDVMTCTTIYRNCVVRNNMIAGAMFQGAMHSMTHCRLYGNQGAQVSTGQDAFVYLENCLVEGGASLLTCRLRRCTITAGLRVAVGGRVENCVLGGETPLWLPPSAAATTSLRDTALAGKTLQWGEAKVDPNGFEAFVAENKRVTGCAMKDVTLQGDPPAAPADMVPADSPRGAKLPEGIGYRDVTAAKANP